MRTRIVVAILALTTLAGTAALARGPGGGHPGREGGPGYARGLHQCLRSPALKLTDAQKDQLKALKESGRNEAKKTFEEMRGLQEALRGAFVDPKADAAAVKAKADALHAAMDRMRGLFFDRLLQARAVLTAEQLTTLAGLPECSLPAQGKGGGRGHGMGGCPGCDCPDDQDPPDDPPMPSK